jgi:hypothetical protein
MPAATFEGLISKLLIGTYIVSKQWATGRPADRFVRHLAYGLTEMGRMADRHAKVGARRAEPSGDS